MKRKKAFVAMTRACIISILSTLLFVGVYTRSASAADKIEIEIYSNPLGSTGYVMSFGLAQIINKYSTKYHATCVETKSQSVNMLHLIKNPNARKNTIGYANPPGYDHCKLGNPPFDHPFNDFRWISMVASIAQIWVSTNPNITKIEDMAGKRIALGTKGHSMEFIPRLLLQHGYGIWDKVKVNNLTFGGIKNAFLDGLVDAGVLAVVKFGPGGDWKGNPASDEVLTTKKCYLISDTEEAIKKTREKSKYSIYPMTLGPRKYGKTTVTKPFIGQALTLSWFVHKDMPAEYVSDILKIIYEHTGDFSEFHASGKGLTQKSMSTVAAPKDEFHPAAVRFYEEHGMKVGE